MIFAAVEVNRNTETKRKKAALLLVGRLLRTNAQLIIFLALYPGRASGWRIRLNTRVSFGSGTGPTQLGRRDQFWVGHGPIPVGRCESVLDQARAIPTDLQSALDRARDRPSGSAISFGQAGSIPTGRCDQFWVGHRAIP